MRKELENVTVSIGANVYFNGNVTSRTVYHADGAKATLGVILPGAYTFPVSDKEVVDITTGTAQVLLPGKTEWERVRAGESFTVPANSEYRIKCDEITEYYCIYVQ